MVDPEVGWDDPPYLNVEWVDPEVGGDDPLYRLLDHDRPVPDHVPQLVGHG